ncbi:hypothetical protein [Litorihabitans aurantiacus]|uniref:Glycerophosphoryl diester phosphodiesterase membrane domain-containing protein n=1 Tax=Litorihabitans aurantiacus TaxID=1930061 RepID=A0AA37XD93_9MICO|nr:hypothetical protein [Litorihabitans aurantiacus]GMA30643.1 hypothetical protein GCM10025875_06350 [Litorihabitans aurantiacus]
MGDGDTNAPVAAPSASSARPSGDAPGARGLGELTERVVARIRTLPRSTWAVGAGVVIVAGAVEVAAARLLPSGGAADALLSAAGVDATAWGEESQAQLRLLVAQVTASALATVLGAITTVVVVGWAARALALQSAGCAAGAGTVWRALRRRVPGMLALAGGTALAVALALLVPAGLGALATATGSDALVALAIVLGTALAVVALGRWLPVVVIALPQHATTDDGGARGSLRRAASLVHGERWRLIGIWLLSVIVLVITAGVVTAPFTALGAMLGGSAAWGAAGSTAASAITGPLGALVCAVVHAELVERHGDGRSAA